MQYVFGFELEYQKYKKTMRSTIYADGIMIDDIILKNRYEHIIKFYTLNIEDLKQIKIVNHCEDSNYMNGFITKSASYRFIRFMFAPKKLLTHEFINTIKKKKQKIRERKYPGYTSGRYGDGIQEPQEIEDMENTTDKWPIFYTSSNFKYKVKNMLDIGKNFGRTTLNESTEIYFDIVKKHNILMCLPVKGYGHIHVGNNDSRQWINMYNENS